MYDIARSQKYIALLAEFFVEPLFFKWLRRVGREPFKKSIFRCFCDWSTRLFVMGIWYLFKRMVVLSRQGWRVLALLGFPIATLATLATFGCGDTLEVPACEDPSPVRVEAQSPHIKNFEMQADVQAGADPWMRIFAVGFSKGAASLLNGSAQLYIDGKISSNDAILLKPIFRSHGLSNETSAGVFGLPLRFGENTTDGSQAVIGVRLTDEAGLSSHCVSLHLQFNLETGP